MVNGLDCSKLKPSFVLISSIDLSTKLIEEQGTEAGQVKRRFKQLRNPFGDRSVLLTSSGTTTYLDPISDQTGQHIETDWDRCPTYPYD